MTHPSPIFRALGCSFEMHFPVTFPEFCVLDTPHLQGILTFQVRKAASSVEVRDIPTQEDRDSTAPWGQARSHRDGQNEGPSWTVDSNYKKLSLPALGRGIRESSTGWVEIWKNQEMLAQNKWKSILQKANLPSRPWGTGPVNSVPGKTGSEPHGAVFWVFCCCFWF